MKIRVRPPTGQPFVLELKDETTFEELGEMVKAKTDMKSVDLLSGFPPKQITGNPKDSVKNLGIKNGDQITVKTGSGVQKGKMDGPYVPPRYDFFAIFLINFFYSVFYLIKKLKTSQGDKMGSLERRKMEGDNSCLFHAVAYIALDKQDSGYELRELAAQIILLDTKTYNEGYLGEKPYAYAQHITNLNVFGGGIELQIFSDYFKIEICSFDLQTCREDHFGLNKGYSRKGFLLYTGDHYDVLALAKSGSSHKKDDQVLFNSSDETVMKKARAFIKDLNQQLMKNGK
eukprot:gene3374-5921_t